MNPKKILGGGGSNWEIFFVEFGNGAKFRTPNWGIESPVRMRKNLYIAPDKNAYLKTNFLISQPKHMHG